MDYTTAKLMSEGNKSVALMELPEQVKAELFDYVLTNLFVARVSRIMDEGLTMPMAIEAVLLHALEE